MGRNLWQGAGAIGFAAMVVGGAVLATQSLGERWEYRALALGMRGRGPRPVPANVVILAVDDRAIGEGASGNPDLVGMEQFPWRRTVYARAIVKMLEAGAAAVAVDLVFEGESPVDAEFAQMLAPYRDRVVLAASNEVSQGVEAQFERLVQPSSTLGPLRQGVVNFPVVPGLEAVFHLGNAHAAEVSQGQKRSFAEEALLAAGLDLAPAAGDLLHFYGPAGTWRTAGQQFSFYQILDRRNWESDLLQAGQKLRGAIVLIGATSEGLQDIQPSAWGRMPGVEIHANAVATLLEQRALRRQGSGWGIVVGLGTVAAVGLYLGRANRCGNFWGCGPSRHCGAVWRSRPWCRGAFGCPPPGPYCPS
ncbi:MAG: CHASE2 domain-containing protein [Oscillatoriales cyanobacterium SM2_1_8]|nr:CHASE2 domain-containing protein [Oscillatoriales cyanobacterium SM2_1_8]